MGAGLRGEVGKGGDQRRKQVGEAQRRWRAKNPERTRQYGRDARRAEKAERLRGMDRTCIRCGGPIPAERSIRATTCSYECRYQFDLAAGRQRTLDGRRGRTCEHCGDELPLTRSSRATTCSEKCRDALNERQWNVRKCRQLSHYALKVGRLVRRPCEVCGSPDVEMHHVDYFEPLNVRWLCFVHHRTGMHGQNVTNERVA